MARKHENANDYAIVSATAKRYETANNRARLHKAGVNVEQFTHMEPSYGYVASPSPETATQHEIKRDRSIIRTSQNTDFMVYAKHENDRHIVGMIRKTGTKILYRHATAEGFGVWHVLRGYTKRVPENVMREVFGIKPYLTAYMVDVKQIKRVTARNDATAISEYGPHDRRPQEYKYRARYPKKRGW